ncbi:carbohydrate binding domain-containing protein [Micromonospora aurantiaca (nom. illeg.)]|uniref:carbohydrate binding domain-containing protein n=1 Tax=Micromonospora aurantiaca (nom. illeg.) TaxID=47850 RepID=UPI003F49FE9B
MAVAITAVVQDTWPPRVLVSVTGLTLGDGVALHRVAAGQRTPVRAGVDDAVTDTSFLRTDAELPFGVPVSYLAVVNDADEYATTPATIALPGGKVAVTDAITGATAEVWILSGVDPDFQRRASVFQVGGRTVVVSGDWGMYSGDLELITETTAGVEALLALFAGTTEGVVQVRQPGGYDGIDAYLAVLGATTRRLSPRSGRDPRRITTAQVNQVESWAPLLEARGTTLQNVADAYSAPFPNQVTNPFFETDVANWVAQSSTIARSTAQAHQGVASMLITPNGVAAVGGAIVSAAAPVVAGRPYRIGMWVYAPTGMTDAGPAVDWNASGGVFISTSFGGAAVPAAVWTYLSVDVVAPPTAVTAAVRARHGGTPAASKTWHVDEVLLARLPCLADIADAYPTLLALAQADLP